ncbi:MAG: hypothetical protein ACYSTL_08595, partial [Planctomycetota bacterium]
MPDDVTVKHWFAFYGVFFATVAVLLVVLTAQERWSWTDWFDNPTEMFAATGTAFKLLGFALYLSVCTTFFPLPTGWIVSALAMQNVAVGGDVWTSTLIVAGVGAVGSTIANLNDYHLFT